MVEEIRARPNVKNIYLESDNQYLLILLAQVVGKNKGQLFVQSRKSLTKLFNKNILINDIEKVTKITTKKFNEVETQIDYVITDNL